MGLHVSTRTRTIRLPNELLDKIEAEAGALGMTVNELLRRRLTKAFLPESGNRKTAARDRVADDDGLEMTA